MSKVKHIPKILQHDWLHRRSALTERRRYDTPEADKWLCCTAVLEVALKRGEFTNEYLDTIPLWKGQGVQEVIEVAEGLKSKSIEDIAQETVRLLGLSPEQEIEARLTGQAILENRDAMPHNWDEIADKFPIVLDFMSELIKSKPVLGSEFAKIIEKTEYFMTYAFNTRIDTENDNLKITAESSRTLFQVIMFTSYCDYLGKNLDDFDAERGILPVETLSRRKAADRLKFYKALKLKLHNDQTYFIGADYWYQCRVDPGSITVVAEHISKIQRRNFTTVKRWLQELIRKYDIATDYPVKQ